MSLQSSQCEVAQVGHDVESLSTSSDGYVCHRRVSCSNSQLARDANLSFFQSQHQALHQTHRQTRRISNPLAQQEDSYYLQLRKRKFSFLNSQDDRSSVPSVTADFLSGIFEDLAQVHSAKSDTYTDSVPNPLLDPSSSDSHLVHSDSEVSNGSCKRFKGMNRCAKSFAHLPDEETLDTISRFHATNTEQEYGPHQHPSKNRSRTTASDSSVLAHLISADLKAAQIADQVFQDSFCDVHIAFPTLPATVSASSCSSNNLTQTSVQAAQVLETPLNTESSDVEGTEQGDTYGWFVEMDEEHVQQRFSAVEAATESCKAIASPPDAELTFRTATVANQVTVELDSEVEWAKAADTVDDVLGELFF